MILTPKIIARLVLIVLLGVVLQLSFFSRIEVLHTSPDVMPALVVTLGLLGGSLTGAVTGFAIGFLIDCLLVAPLGATSLVLISVGYLAGLYRERFDMTSALMPALMCMGLTLFAELAFGAIQLMLGVDAPISALVLRDIVAQSIFAFFLGWPIYYGVRRLLRSALIDEGAVRRRSGPTVLGT